MQNDLPGCKFGFLIGVPGSASNITNEVPQFNLEVLMWASKINTPIRGRLVKMIIYRKLFSHKTPTFFWHLSGIPELLPRRTKLVWCNGNGQTLHFPTHRFPCIKHQLRLFQISRTPQYPRLFRTVRKVHAIQHLRITPIQLCLLPTIWPTDNKAPAAQAASQCCWPNGTKSACLLRRWPNSSLGSTDFHLQRRLIGKCYHCYIRCPLLMMSLNWIAFEFSFFCGVNFPWKAFCFMETWLVVKKLIF